MRIVSGGQTGVDRAALDVALKLGLPIGGWCPAGRWAEDGAIPEIYPLRETPLADPVQRTEWNVRDSDATMVLTIGAPAGGTAGTIEFARALERPVLVHELGSGDEGAAIGWLDQHSPGVLNVAGPRESEVAGVYGMAAALLRSLLAR